MQVSRSECDKCHNLFSLSNFAEGDHQKTESTCVSYLLAGQYKKQDGTRFYSLHPKEDAMKQPGLSVYPKTNPMELWRHLFQYYLHRMFEAG